MQGCFLDAGSVGTRLDWTRLSQALDHWAWHHQTPAEAVHERLAGMDVAVVNKVVLDADAIAAADRLKLICVAATGFNNVDTDAAANRGIPVINVAGYATPAVSQHVLALMLAFATRWHQYDRAVRRGDWQRSPFFCLLDYPIEELADQTLGLIGYGELGSAVARRAEAFGMHIAVAERPGAPAVRAGRRPLADVLADSDYVSLHCPLTESTRHLIDAAALRQMKSSAYLINTARGGIVDDTALVDALRAGVIAGAAVDVLDSEPPRGPQPLIDANLDNLLITPHSAWGSRGARQRVIDGVADNITAFRSGDDTGRVN